MAEMNFIVVLKLVNVFLLASVKYFFSFPYALIIGLTFEQAIIATLIGGIAGFFFFYHLSGILIHFVREYGSVLKEMIPDLLRKKYSKIKPVKQLSIRRNYFTRKNRWLVYAKGKYGFWGIIISSPVLLSIPLGAFLLKKYYSRSRNVVGYMLISIIGWAALFVAITIIFPGLR